MGEGGAGSHCVWHTCWKRKLYYRHEQPQGIPPSVGFKQYDLAYQWEESIEQILEQCYSVPLFTGGYW